MDLLFLECLNNTFSGLRLFYALALVLTFPLVGEQCQGAEQTATSL